jgi:hypothetical protein
MTGFVNPLSRKRSPGYPKAIDHIKATVRTVLDLPDEVVVSVTELTCREPGGLDIETGIAILTAGRKPLTVRFHTSIPDITDADLKAALGTLAREARARVG